MYHVNTFKCQKRIITVIGAPKLIKKKIEKYDRHFSAHVYGEHSALM